MTKKVATSRRVKQPTTTTAALLFAALLIGSAFATAQAETFASRKLQKAKVPHKHKFMHKLKHKLEHMLKHKHKHKMRRLPPSLARPPAAPRH